MIVGLLKFKYKFNERAFGSYEYIGVILTIFRVFKDRIGISTDSSCGDGHPAAYFFDVLLNMTEYDYIRRHRAQMPLP